MEVKNLVFQIFLESVNESQESTLSEFMDRKFTYCMCKGYFMLSVLFALDWVLNIIGEIFAWELVFLRSGSIHQSNSCFPSNTCVYILSLGNGLMSMS